jgi:hypothetical protein
VRILTYLTRRSRSARAEEDPGDRDALLVALGLLAPADRPRR